ncbi:MAG: hypothetical protein S4CHLAM6_10370 [Chlamydiae bacterium]|nr:hypothetical protein [Chlamydiota bacterium]
MIWVKVNSALGHKNNLTRIDNAVINECFFVEGWLGD